MALIGALGRAERSRSSGGCRRAPEPFLPLHVLANPVMRWAPRRPACAIGAMLGLTVYMPLYYEVVH